MSDDGPPRPDVVTVDPGGVPEALRERDRWLVWRYEWQADREEWAKIPKDGAGGDYRIDATNPDNGVAFETAVETYRTGDYNGIGHIMDPDDLLVGFDWDDVRNPDPPRESVPNIVTEMIDTLNSYTELSPSETGYRAFAFGAKPDGPNRADLPCEQVRDDTPHIEVYDGSGGRYLTVTGSHMKGTPETVETRPQEITDIYEESIADDEPPKPTGDGGIATAQNDATPTPDARETGPRDAVADLSDDELLDRAMNAENGEKFRRLWDGDTSNYPSHSEADLALCGLLAFWTGGDHQRIDVLFRQSGLYREKWDRDDYRKRTINQALSGRTEYYDPSAGGGEPSDRTPATYSNTESDTILPQEVLETAAVSSVCPVQRDEDGNLPSLRELRDSEKAEFVWQLATEKGRDDVIAVEGGPLYRYEGGVWHRDSDATHLRNIGHEALKSAYSGSVLNELEERARSANSIQAETLGAPVGTLATDAGLLDMKPAIESGDIHDIGVGPLQPDHYARHKIPVEPDPDADAPRFETFIKESVTDGAQAKLQEYAGYLLWHHAQPFGKALFLLGPTDSGKGTFLRIVKGVLGGDDAPLAAESLQDLTGRWGAAQLFGNWANVRNEVTPGDIDDIQKFKEFTGGGDRVSAEFKGQDKFKFDVTQKFIFAMNQLPDIDNTDGAFWNRLLLVQFPETVPGDEQDKTLDKTIVKEEAAGVLNWMLEGLVRLLDQEEFTNERAIDAKRELVGQYGDLFDRFMDDIVERTGDDHDYVVKRDLLALANAYADTHDMDTPWNGQRGFSRRVHAQGIGSMRTSHGFDDRTRVFTGVTIDENAPDAFGVDVDHGNLTDGQDNSDDKDSDTKQQSLDNRQ